MDREQQRAVEWDCQRTWLSFYARFDNWDYDGMVDLCTPDVVWLRGGKALRGPAHILNELSQRPRTQTIRHSLTNILVFPDAQDPLHASGQCHLIAWRHLHDTTPSGPPTIRHPYLFLMVHADFSCVEGQWLIQRQDMQREFLFPEQEG